MASPKHRVFVTRRVPDEGVRLLRTQYEVNIWDSEEVIPRDKLLEGVHGVSAIFCTISDKINKELLDAAGPNLRVVATMSSGTDHIDQNECKRREICVADCPHMASDSAADIAVALILMTSRRLVEGIDAMRAGQFTSWRPSWMCGNDLCDKVLGIFGFGRVGFGLARRMKPFGFARIIYHDLIENVFANDSGIADMVSFEELIKQSDILCIACTVTPHTIGRFNSAIFAEMKNNAILINTSRGVVVNHDDLTVALQKGQIAAAGLDVTDPEPLPLDHPLMSLPNCVILPHMGTNTKEVRVNMAENTARNILAVLADDE